MFVTDGLIVEEVLRSGDSSNPAHTVLTEYFPCKECACRSLCADCELSCQAYKQYTNVSRKKSSAWVQFPRTTTRSWFLLMFEELKTEFVYFGKSGI